MAFIQNFVCLLKVLTFMHIVGFLMVFGNVAHVNMISDNIPYF